MSLKGLSVAAIILPIVVPAIFAQASTCPSRIQYQPGITLGWTSDTTYDVGTYSSYADSQYFSQGPSGPFNMDCCPSGQISNWTITSARSTGFPGQVSAVCSDGTILSNITLGFNGTASNCSSDLANSTTIPDKGLYTARFNTPIYELLGVGNSTATYPSNTTTFMCDAGLVPIGLGGRSGCSSVTDFKVICAPPYSTLPSSSVINGSLYNCSLIPGLQTIPTFTQIGNNEVMPNTSIYNLSVDTNLPLSYTNPYYVNFDGPFQADCCQTGSIVNWTISTTNWTGLMYDASLHLVGQISATCSDGNILAPITFGFNGTGNPDCQTRGQHLAQSTTVPNPPDNNFFLRTGSQLDQFIVPAASGNPFNVSCPPGTQAIGFGGASNCLSIVLPQIFCAVPQTSLAYLAPLGSPASSPTISHPAASATSSTGLSSGGIAGIVVGVVAALSVAGGLATWIIVRKRRILKEADGNEGTRDALVELGHSGQTSTGTTSGYSDALQSSSRLVSNISNSSGGMTLIPYSEVARHSDTVAIKDLDVNQANPTSFEGLPSRWEIPLKSVSLVCLQNQPIQLGKGGFGSVYKAVVRREEAAIKIVHSSSQNEQARFLHEITVLEQCKSVHIIQFLGYSVAGEDLLLCMEFMPGGTLFDSLGRTGEFQWYERGKQAAKDIAAGLYSLHDQGIAHLDVKSNNILINRERRVKIADLGLGKLVTGWDTAVTQMGTLNWMAPELILKGKCGTASDIYSFSIVLYEICSLKRPKLGLDISEIQVPAQAPMELVELIQACKATEAEQRPTIKEVCDWLDEIP